MVELEHLVFRQHYGRVGNLVFRQHYGRIGTFSVQATLR